MNPTSPFPNPADEPRFAQHAIIDQQHQGLIVCVFEHPRHWQARSQVVWNFQKTSLPVLIYAAAANPNGTESFEFLPVEAFFWLEPNYGFNAVGENRYGLTFMPPMAAAETMMRQVIPKYRGNRTNLRVSSVQPIPNLPQIINQPASPQLPTESICVRVEYEEQGRVFEEEFCGIQTWNQAQGGSSVQTNWGFERLFCFRAARGQLDAARQTFWQIASSVRPNPQWQQVYQQITQQLNSQFEQHTEAVYAKLRAEQQYSQQLSAYNQQLNDQRSQNVQWSIERQQQLNQQRSQSTYTNQEAFGDALLGRTAYQDPNSSTGNYQYDYGHHEYGWTNNQGAFHFTNDPVEDPNIGSTQTWERAKKVRED